MNQTATANINDLIIDEIFKQVVANGDFAVVVEIDNHDGTTTEIAVNGRTEWDGYQETDYFDGTGNWVTSHAEASVSSVDICRFGIDGEEFPAEDIEIDKREIESAVIDWLMS